MASAQKWLTLPLLNHMSLLDFEPPLLSIVVPIYNVENYIEKSVRSLFEQTYPNIEYIFVNDCTPDKSMGVLDSVLADYPHRVSNVVVINHTQNKGLAISRHDGFVVAKGEYIATCDSDDWVELDMYENLMRCAKCRGGQT